MSGEKNNGKKIILLEVIIAVAAVILDQLSKYIVVKNIYQSSAEFIPGVLGFRYCENTGAAFSMFSNGTMALAVVSIIMVVLLVLAMELCRRHEAPWQINACFALIAGGAVGNLIDRLFLGYVVDFFEVQFFEFAIFNVADSFVCVGVALLLIYIIFTKKGRKFFKEFDKPKQKADEDK